MDARKAPTGTQAVVRAIGLLKAFSASRPAMTLAELCSTGELSRTTAHRLLAALESEDLVARDAGGRYHLGPAVLALGARALASSDLRAVVQPVLESLAAETGETATLEVLSEGKMLIIGEVSGRHLVSATPEIGTRWPLHATSSGKALLAALPDKQRKLLLKPPLARLTESTITDPEELERELARARARGYATAIEEIEIGAAAAAAVIRDAHGNPMGAISVGGPASRLSRRRLSSLGKTLRQTAEDLTRRLEPMTPR